MSEQVLREIARSLPSSRRRLRTASWALGAVVYLLLASPVHAGLALDSADAPGFEVTKEPAPPTRAALRALAPGGLGKQLLKGEGETSELAAGQVTLRSAGFLLASERVAKKALRRWLRIRRKGGATLTPDTLGDEGWRAEGRPLRLAWRTGRGLGLLSIDAPSDASELLAAYGTLLQARLGPEAARSEWERVIARLDPTGEPSLQTALDAFALAYRSIPGSRHEPTRDGVFEGTLAGRWILSYWDQLASDQRKIVERALGLNGLADTAARRREPYVQGMGAPVNYGDPDFAPNATLQSQVDLAIDMLAEELRMVLPFEVVAGVSPNAAGLADTFTIDAAGSFTPGGDVAMCRIRFGPEIFEADTVFQKQVAVHEGFHCFQGAIMEKTYLQPPRRDWMLEGSADWAALAIIPTEFDSRAASSLQEYVTTPSDPLFGRAYAASGFFGHADEVGGDLWAMLPHILRAPDSVASFAEAGATTAAFLDSWASSVWRIPGLGPNWTMASPVQAGFNPEPLTPWRPIWDFGGIVQAAPYTTTHYQIHTSGEGVLGTAGGPLVHVAIDGHARLADRTIDTTDLDDDWFCVRPPCTCPVNSQGTVPPARLLNLPALLAVTGDPDADGSFGFVHLASLEEFCHTQRSVPKSPGPPGPQPPLGGGGSSNGDPHLKTFDGVSYDFQATGEFTLVRATTDDLEIQVRQEPVHPDSRFASMNTALAVRIAGDRVIIERGAPMIVRVNGVATVVPIGTTRALPGGGWITAYPDQLAFVWPDETEARVWPVGIYGLALLVRPAAWRRGHLHGLLGDANGNGDDDFVTRDGMVLDPTAIFGLTPAAYALLYSQFGESWRITPATTLFEYPEGKTTESYTDRTFPDALLRIDDLSVFSIELAEAVCRDAGITRPSILEGCILDVGITNDPAFATAGAILEATSAESAVPTWTPLPALAWRTDLPALAATADGVLHAVAPTRAAAVDTLIHVSIAADGTTSAATTVESYLVGTPHLAVRPDGGLHVTVPGIRTPPAPDPSESGAFTFDAPETGAAWARGPFVKTGGFSYLGFAPATFGPAAALFTVLPTNGSARIFRGTDFGPGDEGIDPGSGLACATLAPSIVSDGNAVWVAWTQDFCRQLGYWAAPLDPITGALAAPPARAPDSTYVVGGNETFTSPIPTVATTARRNQSGVWIAYPQRRDDGYHVLVWRLGTTTTIDAGVVADEPERVALATEPSTERLWVAWTQANHLAARRLSADADALESGVQTVDAPPTALGQLDWTVAARNGQLDVLAGIPAAGDTPGETWHTAIRP